jgi:NAD(P)-dependent dehydrogenase (short-subunit alcohol dehydrogenase family)
MANMNKTTKTAKTAIITGANRGLGLEASRQLARKGYQVILTSRDEKKGALAAELLRKEGLSVTFRQLDVADDQSVQALAEYVGRELGGLDVLINNAGVFLDEFSVAAIRESMETNAYGPFRMMQAFLPLMKKRGSGRVVNVSTGMSQLSEMNGGYPGYRMSKVALNAATRIFSDEYGAPDLQINCVCPGWVKTDMGGAGAERDVEKGVETIVWLATQPAGGPTGGFFRDQEKIDW